MSTRTPSASRLAGVSILTESDDAELARVERLATVVEVPSDRRVLMHEGAVGNEFLMLISGSVEVVVGSTTIAELGPGDVVGELALLLDVPRTATVRTTAPAEIAVIPRAEFAQFLVEAPNATRRLLRTVAGRALGRRGAGRALHASDSAACPRPGR